MLQLTFAQVRALLRHDHGDLIHAILELDTAPEKSLELRSRAVHHSSARLGFQKPSLVLAIPTLHAHRLYVTMFLHIVVTGHFRVTARALVCEFQERCAGFD
jgi:hypothetical protein